MFYLSEFASKGEHFHLKLFGLQNHLNLFAVMRYLIFSLALIALTACQQEQKKTDQTTSTNNPDFTVQTTPDSELQYENLRLYPVVAEESFVDQQQVAADYKNLKEAIEDPKFRITEKKHNGRFSDRGAVNTLSAQNKSDETIYMMAGDVVTGGKQDRVIAMDLVIPARTIADIPVFCVEKGRWSYRDAEDNQEAAADKDKKVYAFTGYYNVASNDIRRTVKHTQSQDEVWKKVGEVTMINNASSQTNAYTGLETSEDFTQTRDSYLRFFQDKFAGKEKVIGMVAVSGSKVLGADLFGHPNLFQKQYEALLHSYVTEAITSGSEITFSAEQMEQYGERLWKDYQKSSASEDAKFSYEGVMIHFTDL